jgi:hypothetical protein
MIPYEINCDSLQDILNCQNELKCFELRQAIVIHMEDIPHISKD